MALSVLARTRAGGTAPAGLLRRTEHVAHHAHGQGPWLPVFLQGQSAPQCAERTSCGADEASVRGLGLLKELEAGVWGCVFQGDRPEVPTPHGYDPAHQQVPVVGLPLGAGLQDQGRGPGQNVWVRSAALVYGPVPEPDPDYWEPEDIQRVGGAANDNSACRS
jgi:hypothetical protein